MLTVQMGDIVFYHATPASPPRPAIVLEVFNVSMLSLDVFGSPAGGGVKGSVHHKDSEAVQNNSMIGQTFGVWSNRPELERVPFDLKPAEAEVPAKKSAESKTPAKV